MDAVGPVNAAAGPLAEVSPKISDVRAALKRMVLTLLLAYVVLRLDVAAKAGACRC